MGGGVIGVTGLSCGIQGGVSAVVLMGGFSANWLSVSWEYRSQRLIVVG